MICLLLWGPSCGNYYTEDVKLTSAQIEKIKQQMSKECITDNKDLFDQLKTYTDESFDDSGKLKAGSTYKITKSGSTTNITLVILKASATKVYYYLNDPSIANGNRVYLYTKENNDAHVDSIASLACASPNQSFSKSAAAFTYNVNSYSPNQTDDDRKIIETTFKVDADLPVVFSLYQRTYKSKTFVANKEEASTDIASSLSPSDRVNVDDYETKFNEALHCTFISSSWLGVDAEEYIAKTSNVTCSNTSTDFSWANDIIGE